MVTQCYPYPTSMNGLVFDIKDPLILFHVIMDKQRDELLFTSDECTSLIYAVCQYLVVKQVITKLIFILV